MGAKRTSWNEFSSAMASAVICLSTGHKYIFESLVRNVDSSSKLYMYPRVGKGCSGVKTPLFEGVLVAGDPEVQGDAEEQGNDFSMSLLQEALDACAALTRRVEHLEHDKVAQDLEITKLKTRVKKLKRANKEDEPEVQEAVEVVTTAKLITKVVAAVSESVTAASATITAVPSATITAAPVRVAAASTRRRKGVVIRDPEVESTVKTPTETKSKDKGKGIMVEEQKPIKKKKQVEIDEEYVRKLHEDLNKDIDWDVAIDHVKQKAKEDPYV
nr:hypothetical protein [Tanacetum cinerariifolium]